MEHTFDWTIFFSVIYALNSILAIAVTIKVVLDNRNPTTTFAWISVLLFLPYIGLILYFFFGHDNRKRKYIRKRFSAQIKQRSALSYRSYSNEENIPEYGRLVSYLENVAEAYPMRENNIELLCDTALFIEKLLASIKSATSHIHLQFYIFENDATGLRVRDALCEKAREGVEVRVIYDSVGCLSVKPSFFDEIRRSGGYVESFLKVRFPLFTNKVNYRNHRKVVVIDGTTGFVGGCNIADRYLKGINGGVWRDTMLMVRGSGVYALQSSFLVDWYFTNGSLVSGKRYFPELPSCNGTALMQVLTSNPIGKWSTISGGLAMTLARSDSYVYLQTPYLMPNDKVLSAMQNAALAGVDVRLMIPERSDSRLADYATRSFIEELLKAGVKIYIYNKGFMHAKTLVSDNMLSVVGSANLDFRSFDYNFEVCAYVYDAGLARDMRAAFMNDISDCTQLSLRDFSQRSLFVRCLESAARLASPVL